MMRKANYLKTSHIAGACFVRPSVQVLLEMGVSHNIQTHLLKVAVQKIFLRCVEERGCLAEGRTRQLRGIQMLLNGAQTTLYSPGVFIGSEVVS
jgi:hypothetical protein